MKRRNRRGVIAIIAAILMVVLLAMVAFSVDVGYMSHAKTELQVAVDAGVLAGAGVLPQRNDERAVAEARNYVRRNFGHDLADDEIEVVLGRWDLETRRRCE